MRALAAFALALAVGAPAAADPAKLYAEHCASCHGADRFGGMGPALLPSNLERLRKPAAVETIAKGRVATQMPAFADKLSAAEITQLTDYVYAPPATPPAWGADEIRASRIEHANAAALPGRPKFGADPLNLFVVVEAGDHHVTILDGDRFEPLARFASRYALHGGPKFSPDGRFVYFASRDGWISKYDLWNLALVAEVRAGLNTRNAAVSGDGKYVAVANYLPHTLTILDANLELVKVLPVADREGKRSSRVSAVYDAAPRRSFVVALKDVQELWEVSYDPQAADIPVGLIHDFRYREGAFLPGFLNPRRTQLDDYLDDFFFTQDYSELVGDVARRAARAGGPPRRAAQDRDRRPRRHAAPGLRHQLAARRAHGRRDAEPEGRSGERDRREGLEGGETDPDPRPGLLHAQPRSDAVRLGRFDDEPREGHADDPRQAHARAGRDRAARAGKDARAHRVHPRRPLRAREPAGSRTAR